jgi:hypothetical protein
MPSTKKKSEPAYRLHPAMSILPLPTPEEWAAILDNVRKLGQKGHIEVVGRDIVFGANEWRACKELKIAPRITQVKPPEEVVEYIVRRNVPPQSLTFLDRCCIAVLGKAEFQRITKKAMVEGGSKGGKAKGKARAPDARPFEGPRWFEHAAKIVGVNNARAISTLDGIRAAASDVFEWVRGRKIEKLNDAKTLQRDVPKASDRADIMKRVAKEEVDIIPAIHDLVRKTYIASLPKGVFAGKRYKILVGDMEEQAASLQDGFCHLAYADIEYGPPRCYEMAAKAARIASRILLPGGVFCMIGGHVHFETLAQIVSTESKGELKGIAIGFYHYPNASHGLADHANLVQRVDADYCMFFSRGPQLKRAISSLVYRADNKVKKPHIPWEKNLKATTDLVEAAVGKAAVVVDLCCGSATTGEAAMRLDGWFTGIEMNPKTADIAARRLTKVEAELMVGIKAKAAKETEAAIKRAAKKPVQQPFEVVPEIREVRPERPPVYCIVKDGLLVVRHRKAA